jgi:hypothetical protein
MEVIGERLGIYQQTSIAAEPQVVLSGSMKAWNEHLVCVVHLTL